MISLPDLAYRLRARRALLIGARQAAVYEWRDNVAVRRAVFEAGEEGRQGFRRYLAETPGIPFYLLVDVADEEYRQDTVPHLSRRDRQALLKRKAARLFKDTGYCFFRVTGRETTGRRDDRVLLSALANPGIVRQWVAILDEARTPLAGICSLPLFSGQLLKVIAGRDDGCRLLVSMQSVSGLRQTCFDNGALRFSRLVQTSRAEQESLSEMIGDEVEKVLRYLDSRRADAPAGPVHVHFLFAGDLLQELKTVLKQQDSVTYHFCDLRELAGENACSKPVPDSSSDAYFMQQLLSLRPGNVYAGAAERRWFFLGRLRAGVAAAGFAMLLGSAGWSALKVYGGIVLYLGGKTAEEETHRYAAEYELARKRLPETPVDPPDLKTAVMIADSLAQNKTSPIGMVTVLGHSLHGFPAIRLSSISWMVTGDPDTAFAGGSDHAAPIAMDVPGAVRSLYQAALVKGRLEPFDGNYREAMDAINRFAEDLRAREAVSGVDIVALPLDTSSGTDLQGNTQSLQNQAEFTLKLVLKNEPAIPAEFRGQSKNL
ncbi:MAG: hypothetical protein OXS28_10955 [Gammaproteobacteria bacterium]|nr:hypothetical protein [Gammaproteobacteria bacterium]